jgi:hypothetical protein
MSFCLSNFVGLFLLITLVKKFFELDQKITALRSKYLKFQNPLIDIVGIFLSILTLGPLFLIELQAFL